MQIRREQEVTYSNIPNPYLDVLGPIFTAQGFEYECLYGDEIPDHVPPCVDLEGRLLFSGVCCVKSHMNADDIHRMMLSVWNPYKYGEVSAL